MTPTFEGGRERWVSDDGTVWVTEYPDGRAEVITLQAGGCSYFELDELTKGVLFTILDVLEEAKALAMKLEA